MNVEQNKKVQGKTANKISNISFVLFAPLKNAEG